MAEVIYDFAAARPSVGTLKANGAIAACRYHKAYQPNSYQLTQSERLTYLAGILGVGHNMEQAADSLLTQSESWWYAYGKATGDRMESWGVPQDEGICVLVSLDTTMPASAWPKVFANMKACANGLGGRYGVRGYGPVNFLRLLHASGLVPTYARHWLTNAAGWSGFPSWDAQWNAMHNDPIIGIIQRYQNTPIPDTDINVVINVNGMGIEWPVGSPHHPNSPTPAPAPPAPAPKAWMADFVMGA